MSRYAVVTGGTKGIGKAICHTLAKAGMHIATCARSAEDLQVLSSQMEVYGVQVITKTVDVSNVEAVKAFAEHITHQWPHVNILINNAGIFIPGAVLGEDEGNLEMMMQTNLYSAYYLTRHLMPLLYGTPHAHIFNMCSVASKMAYPNGGSYSISKFALLGFSKSLREELKEKSVRVTSLLPGATWSDSWKDVDLPQDRLMSAQDIADTVLSIYNLSDAAVVEEVVLRPQLGDL